MGETQFAWNGGGGCVRRVTVNFEAVDVKDLKRNLDQRGSRLGYQPLVDVVLVNPVTNLQFAFPKARVQAGAAEQFCVVLVENAINKILSQIEQAAKPFEALDLFFERFGFAVDPRHPRAQVFEAFRDRLSQQWRVGRIVTTYDQPLRFDAIGRV